MRPRLLDLFCGAGGASMGYHRAGFEVVGVDIKPQPRYPFAFHRGDALEMLESIIWRQAKGEANFFLGKIDAVHASPPCQRYSPLAKLHKDVQYPDLIAPVRGLLDELGLPYVIENVPGAPLREPFKMCGSSFGLDVRRHRLFETNWPMGLLPPCAHHLHTPRFQNTGKRRRAVLSSVVGVYGGSHFKGDNLKYRSDAMGIDWMQMDELSEAIPPAYTEHIGIQLLQAVAARQCEAAVTLLPDCDCRANDWVEGDNGAIRCVQCGGYTGEPGTSIRASSALLGQGTRRDLPA